MVSTVSNAYEVQYLDRGLSVEVSPLHFIQGLWARCVLESEWILDFKKAKQGI